MHGSSIEMSSVTPLRAAAAAVNSSPVLRTVQNIAQIKSSAIEERAAKRPRSPLFHEEVLDESTRHLASHEAAAGTYARLMNGDQALQAEIGAASLNFLLKNAPHSTPLLADRIFS